MDGRLSAEGVLRIHTARGWLSTDELNELLGPCLGRVQYAALLVDLILKLNLLLRTLHRGEKMKPGH